MRRSALYIFEGALWNMARDPLRAWQEQYASCGTLLGFKPEGDTPFSSSVQLICDSPGIVRTTLSPGLLFRDKNMVRDGNDNRSLVVALGGGLTFRHLGHEAPIKRHEATVVQNDEPGEAAARRYFTLLEISIPQREWAARTSRSSDALMKVVNSQSESLRLLLGYVGVLGQTRPPATTETRASLSRHLIDLTVLAATEPSVGESEAACVVAARRAAVLEHIAARFQDPDLTGASVALSLGISQRYLQRLLQDTGQSFTQHITERRLDRAFALLGAGVNRRVSDIAFEVGFSDLTHFYRLLNRALATPPMGIFGSLGGKRQD